ncbi:GNAT family N-acetyltransferase [Parachitinimonas caeni]|uniref:GNAT family N-acetyltransferase n=1 Tax=Parachitinimonas caeni TaxID=3031301 RepID=A0ABT7DTS2_9NEIS|nr:GNAT family N-acetyltransferase [Parachitinimonas caeni]MDK2122483.1 GNAT family N-acetyltransferase [Parachitinimonas caeni]
MQLLPFDLADLPRLLAMQAQLPLHQKLYLAANLSNDLTDHAHGNGRQVRVAWREGMPVGLAGWVNQGVQDGEFYGLPVIAADHNAALLLVELLIGEAKRQGAHWLRINTYPEESGKITALHGSGFSPVFEFVDLEIALPTNTENNPMGFGLHRIAIPGIDFTALSRLHNRAFLDVPNAPAITPDELARIWLSPAVHLNASQVWLDSHGKYRAYLLIMQDGSLHSFGVDFTCRGQGIAKAMLSQAARVAHQNGLSKLESVVASTNVESWSLHQSFGFIETGRRTVWQKNLRQKLT